MSALHFSQAQVPSSECVAGPQKGPSSQGKARRVAVPVPRLLGSSPVVQRWCAQRVGGFEEGAPSRRPPFGFRERSRMPALPADGLTTAPEAELRRGGPGPGKQLPSLRDLKAVLFDVDGTLAHSDPLHYLAFKEILVEVGFQGGRPIDEEFFRKHISGRHNPDIGAELFPDWPVERRDALLAEKEARFRKVAAQQTLEVPGLSRLCQWTRDKGLSCAAVTNAPRANAEQMIASLGLTSFFEYLIIGSECARAKPFPEPYLLGLEKLGVAAEHACAVEDSPAGMRAAVAAGLPTIGVLTGQEASVLDAAGAAFTVVDFNDPLLWKQLEAIS